MACCPRGDNLFLCPRCRERRYVIGYPMEAQKKRQLDVLNQEIKKCRQCRLHSTRTHAVCGEGSLDATLLLVGQAPGETEDSEGRMFIGRAGRTLDELL